MLLKMLLRLLHVIALAVLAVVERVVVVQDPRRRWRAFPRVPPHPVHACSEFREAWRQWWQVHIRYSIGSSIHQTQSPPAALLYQTVRGTSPVTPISTDPIPGNRVNVARIEVCNHLGSLGG